MTVLSLGLTTRITLNVTVALPPSGLSTSLNPVFVGLTPGLNGNSTLTITTTPSTPAGVYSVMVTGASGTLVHSVTLTLIVNPDFRIIAGASSPSSFVAGGSTTSAVTMNSLGFNGTVSLSATLTPSVAGFTSSFNTRNIGLIVGSTGSAILTIQSSITTPSGTYTATIVATSGSITHSTSISFIVLPNFTMGSSVINPANVLAGSSASSTISLNSFGLGANVHLTLSIPSGMGLAASVADVNIPLTPGSSGTTLLTIGTSISTPSGLYSINVTGTSGSLTHSILVSISVGGDLTITASPASPSSLVASGSTRSIITVTSLGFTGTVNVTGFSSPTALGLAISISSPTIVLSPGSSRISTVTITTDARTPGPQTYTVTTTAAGSGLVHSATEPFLVNPDFTITASDPTPNNFIAGASASSTVTVSSQGFIGTVSMSTGTPSGINGLTAFLSSNSVSLLPGSTVTDSLTIATTQFTPSGTYSITVTGSSGSLSHTVSVLVTVNPDFTLSAQAATPASFVAGRSASSTVTLSSLGLTGTVSLTATSSPSDPSITFSFTPTGVSLNPGASGTSTLAISTTSSTPSATYTITVTASFGSITHTSTLSITVTPDLAITTSTPNPGSFVAGNSATSTVTVVSIGLTGTVAISSSVTPSASGLSVSFSSANLPLTPGTSGTSTLTLSTTAFTPANSYSVTVTATSGSITHSVVVTVTVTGDFTIVASSPSPASVVAGKTATSTVTLTSLGLTDSISITATVSPSATGLTPSFSPAIVSLTPGSQGTSILTLQTTASTPSGTYTISLAATGGSPIHPFTLTLSVTPDFAILSSSASPGSFVSGGQATSAVTVNSFGFTGTVSLAASVSPQASGLTAVLSASSVDLTPGSTGTLTLTISTSAFTPSGSYSVTINGVSGSFSHTNTPSITVTLVPDFTLTALAPSPSSIVSGNSATSMVTVSSLGLTGAVSLTATGTPPATDFTVSLSISPSLTPGGSSSSTLTIATSPSTPAGTYTVTVTGTGGGQTHSVNVQITILADFTISATPATPSVFVAGGSSTSSISLNSFGMTGNVALSASVTPSGTQIPGISISPLSVSITPGSLGSSTLTISSTSSTSSGSYTIAITGTIAGTSPHTASVQVTVNPDFTINSSPTNPPPFVAGNVAITTIGLSSNGLTGTVTLSAAVPASATGASVSFTVNPIGLSAGGSGVSTLTFSTTSVTPAGTYSVPVTGSSGLVAHSVTLAITVTGDFKATVSSPTQSSFIAGGSADATITLDSLGFTGRIDISASSSH